MPRAIDADAAQQRLLRTEAEARVGLVLVVEALGEIEETGFVERDAFGDRHAHVEVLARVTHLRVEVAVDVGRARPGRVELLVDFLEQVGHAGRGRGRGRPATAGVTYERTRSTT